MRIPLGKLGRRLQRGMRELSPINFRDSTFAPWIEHYYFEQPDRVPRSDIPNAGRAPCGISNRNTDFGVLRCSFSYEAVDQ